MDMERTKPSSKIIALAIIVVAIVVASWLIKSDAQVSETNEPNITVSSAERTYAEELDSDGDGLKDWEELLWGFDPNNPDTDGDGVPDGIEKREAQSAALTRQQEFAKLLDPTGNPNWKSLSYTEQVSGLLLSNYLTFKQSGLPLTEADALAIVESIPTYELPERAAPRIYSLSDIRVSAKSDASALRAYGNAVGSVLSVPEGDNVKNEIVVLVSFMQTGNDAVFMRDVYDVVARYDYVIAEMLKIPVPVDIATEHLAAINALSLVRNTIQGFHSFTGDPFLALSVFTEYNENTTQRGKAFGALRSAFETANVTFSKTEPGYLLTHTGTPSS